MCGIVGYTGSRRAVDLLLKGLERLEYRGYDSSGVAYFEPSGKISIRKSEGKLANVRKILAAESDSNASMSHCGIGHTRWATHGKPTTQNAHPHRVGSVVLVHNGIIENYLEIRDELVSRGHRPKSETDSELFGFLVVEELDRSHSFPEAVRRAFLKLKGACSVVVMNENDPGVVIGVRNGAPLVVAKDPQGGTLIASDAQPLLEYSRDVIFLENGDFVIARGQGEMEVQSIETGARVARKSMHLDWSADQFELNGYPHYMLKEIHEQPGAWVDTLNAILDRASGEPFPLAPQPGVALLEKAQSLILIACGTSWHAALLGKYWLERFARIPVQVELASEFRYREPVLLPGTLVVGLSQSGETADTLAVIREMRAKKVPTLGLTNVRGSTLAREADAVFFTSAGPEVGVAATKTFTTQMIVLLLWAGALSVKRGYSEATQFFSQVLQLPHGLEAMLRSDGPLIQRVREAAKKLESGKGVFFIGRGFSFPIALEGALKLKEIAYVHAEGYAAGELKHGPIAMIDEDMWVVVLAPKDSWRDKTVSNLEEVKARGAKILGVGNEEDESLKRLCDVWLSYPKATESWDESLLAFFTAPVVQLLSYEIALLKGTDVDKPRNLAKSVTVE